MERSQQLQQKALIEQQEREYAQAMDALMEKQRQEVR